MKKILLTTVSTLILSTNIAFGAGDDLNDNNEEKKPALMAPLGKDVTTKILGMMPRKDALNLRILSKADLEHMNSYYTGQMGPLKEIATFPQALKVGVKMSEVGYMSEYKSTNGSWHNYEDKKTKPGKLFKGTYSTMKQNVEAGLITGDDLLLCSELMAKSKHSVYGGILEMGPQNNVQLFFSIRFGCGDRLLKPLYSIHKGTFKEDKLLFSGCNFSQSMPPEIFEQKGLVCLDLGECGIEILPEEISELKNLDRLGIEGNNLKILPDSVLSLPKLTVLHIKFNRLSNNEQNRLKENYPHFDKFGWIDQQKNP